MKEGYPLSRGSYDPEMLVGLIAEVDIRLAALDNELDAEQVTANHSLEVTEPLSGEELDDYIVSLQTQTREDFRTTAWHAGGREQLLRLRASLEALLNTGNS